MALWSPVTSLNRHAMSPYQQDAWQMLNSTRLLCLSPAPAVLVAWGSAGFKLPTPHCQLRLTPTSPEMFIYKRFFGPNFQKVNVMLAPLDLPSKLPRPN